MTCTPQNGDESRRDVQTHTEYSIRSTHGAHPEKANERGAKRETDQIGRDPQLAISASAGIPYYH